MVDAPPPQSSYAIGFAERPSPVGASAAMEDMSESKKGDDVVVKRRHSSPKPTIDAVASATARFTQQQQNYARVGKISSAPLSFSVGGGERPTMGAPLPRTRRKSMTSLRPKPSQSAIESMLKRLSNMDEEVPVSEASFQAVSFNKAAKINSRPKFRNRLLSPVFEPPDDSTAAAALGSR